MSKHGRNDPCACGSGKKFKRCCAGRNEHAGSGRLMLIVVIGAVIGAILLVAFGMMDDGAPPGPGRVWSVEHGHWH
jgi:hypothetical protein